MPVAIKVPLERRRIVGGRTASVCLMTTLALAFGWTLPAVAAPVPVARTVDDMVEHLRSDPVLVQPVLGMGDAPGAHELLTDLAADVNGPVYVVLADTPEDLASTDGASEQAAALLRAELGDGLYYVQFADGIRHIGAWGEAAGFDHQVVWDAVQRAVENGPGDYPRTSGLFEAVLTLRAAANPGQPLPAEVLEELAEQPWAFIPKEHYERADAVAGRWVATLGTAIAILIAGSVMTVLVHRAEPQGRRGAERGRPGRGAASRENARQRPDTDAGIPPDIERTARDRWTRARRRFENLSARELALPQADTAEEALDAAERALATGNELDAVGAYVLALQAERELRRIGKSNVPRYRPCFINPMHPEARGTVRIAGSTIDAPVCPRCQGGQGSFMVARTRWGRRPYVETKTVWARTGFGALVDDLARYVLDDRGSRR